MFLWIYVVLCLSIDTIYADEGTTIIHSIILKNDTILPKFDGLPLVGKCCPVNEILVKDENQRTICVPSNESALFLPLFSDFNRTGVLIPGDNRPVFTAVVGDPCLHNKYMLYPEEANDDEYYLLLNGSIFAPRHVPRMLTPGKDYCMEVVPSLGLRTFVCFPEELVVTTADSRITFYACGLLISVPFFILTIVAYSITPKLWNVHGKALCHYCGCLALAFSTLAIAQLASARLSDQVCVSVAFVIQFSFVASFFWLNVMCIEIWCLVRYHINPEKYTRTEAKLLFFYYSLWAWGPPAILILISMIMDLSPTIPLTYVKPSYGTKSCWFKSDVEAMPYFYVPVSLLLLCNLVTFFMTAVKMTRHQQQLTLRRMARNQESVRQEQRFFDHLKRTFLACVVLFLLMGLNWCMELISWWAGGDPLDWSAFDLLNALQGVLVFGLFVLRRPPRDFIWFRIQQLRGIDTVEPEEVGMGVSLLPVINDDSLPRQTTIP